MDEIDQDFETFIERMRERLLDTTRRSRLLNFDSGRASTVWMIDGPSCDGILRAVPREQPSTSGLRLEPVPNPESGNAGDQSDSQQLPRSQWPSALDNAKKLGWAASRDLPHDDGAIEALQALKTEFYRHDLWRVASNLSKTNASQLSEAGLHTLRLVLGFLEWSELKPSDQREPAKSFIAPLLSVPAYLERPRRSTMPFSLSRDDDLEDNETLRVKLDRDLGLLLPRWEPDDEKASETSVETYFQAIEAMLRRGGEEIGSWRVLRRAAIANLSFAAQRLYQDLGEPATRAHSIVRRLNEGKTKPADFGRQPDLDNLVRQSLKADHDSKQREPLPAVIFDADSSQHAVLIDVLEHGKDLAVEGPPGTGKSQTIANLIAGAMAAGKSVLFVSQKAAALEVVLRRLQVARLSDFCLPLHGAKGSKSEFLSRLSRRLTRHHNRDHEAAGDISLQFDKSFWARWRDMGGYANLLHEPLAGSGNLTRWEIIWRAERARTALGDMAASLLTKKVELSGNVSPADIEQLLHDYVNLSRSQEKVTQGVSLPVDCVVLKSGASPGLFRDASDLACQKIEFISELLEAVGNKLPVGVLDASLNSEELSSQADLVLGLRPPDVSNQALVSSLLHAPPADIENVRRLLLASEFVGEGSSLQWLRLDKDALPKSVNEEDLTLGLQQEAAAHWARTIEKFETFLLQCGASPAEDRDELVKVIGAFSKLPAPGTDFPWRNLPDAQIATENQLKALVQKAASDREKFEAQSAHVLPVLKGKLSADHIPKYKQLVRDLARAIKQSPDLQSQSLSNLPSELQKKARFLAGSTTIGIAQFREALLRWIILRDPEQPQNWLVMAGRLPTWVSCALLVRDGAHRIQHLEQLVKGAITKDKDKLGLQLLRKELSSGESLLNLAILFDERAANAKTTINQLDDIGLNTAGSIKLIHKKLEQMRVGIQARDTLIGTILSPDCLSTTFDWRAFLDDAVQASKWIKKVVHVSPNFAPLTKLSGSKSDEFWEKVGPLLHDLKAKLDLFEEALQQLQEIAIVDWRFCQTNATTPREIGVQQLQPFLMELRSLEGLGEKDTLDNLRKRLLDQGLGPLLREVEAGKVPVDMLADAFNFVRYRQQRDEDPKIARIRSHAPAGWKSRQQEFVTRDGPALFEREQQRISKIVMQRHIAEGVGGKGLKHMTDLCLLEAVNHQKRPRMPVRQIIRQANDALRDLFPCFMMSPLSVATYIRPDAGQFDLVVMDEASQMPVEEAIGAVARGAQLVVVGDDKQMPPSSLFRRVILDDDGADPTEQSITEAAESILDVCQQIFERRRLIWHYRSNHHSLIDFSNRQFYDEELIVFPTAQDRPDLGIELIEVPEDQGRFANGVNAGEAATVIEVVLNHLASQVGHPEPRSLAIVTMNAKQQLLVEELLEAEIEKSDEFLELSNQLADRGEPIIVKNLENIQGDERDTVVLSMTYARRSDGRFFNRFGDINHKGGWRRLNVMFTRARDKLIVVTSLRSNWIKGTAPDGDRFSGNLVLKDFLNYARVGGWPRVHQTDRLPESPFEEAVCSFLEQHSVAYETQLGVEQYRIDIAVPHPTDDGSYVLAIECDGASYHAHKSARDRDRLRQERLESLGWLIHRIWSTDWFYDRPACEQALLEAIGDALKDARERSSRQEIAKPERTTSVPGLVEIAEQRATEFASEPGDTQALDEDPATSLEGPVVETGDRVRLRYLDNGDEKEFIIVGSRNDLEHGKLGMNSPLAHTIRGRAAGQVVDFELADGNVRQIEISKISKPSSRGETTASAA